jgi:hypothetical protein
MKKKCKTCAFFFPLDGGIEKERRREKKGTKGGDNF